jgi:hypothetical protein
MKKAAFVLSIVALSVSVVTLAITVLELFFKKINYIDSNTF